MKKKYALLSVLSMVLLLAVCTNIHIGSELTATENSDKQLSDKYVDVNHLPILDIDVADKYVFDDRTIALEDSIDNELEQLAYKYYYDVTSAQFEDLMDFIGENESLQIAMENEGVNYHNGIYMSEYTIHELTTLTVDDLPTIGDASKKDIMNKIDTFDFTEYAIVRVDVSMKHNKAYLSQGPQLGDGRYVRYYLFATTMDLSQFKMYQVYWENFIVT